MSTRLSLVLDCPMQFAWYPFDRQICHIRLASYAHTTSEVILFWKDISPVQKLDFHVAGFHLENIKNGNTTSSTESGEYITLTVDLTMKRTLPLFMTQYFLPTIVLVILSWFAFWMHPDMMTPRILLGVVCLITIYHLQTGTLLQHIATGCCTAFAVWAQVCSLFVLLSLLETVLVNYWTRRDTEIYKLTSKHFDDGLNAAPLLTSRVDTYALARDGMPITRGERTDSICRCGFPLLFFVFSVVYWAICLSS